MNFLFFDQIEEFEFSSSSQPSSSQGFHQPATFGCRLKEKVEEAVDELERPSYLPAHEQKIKIWFRVVGQARETGQTSLLFVEATTGGAKLEKAKKFVKLSARWSRSGKDGDWSDQPVNLIFSSCCANFETIESLEPQIFSTFVSSRFFLYSRKFYFPIDGEINIL